MSTATKHVQTPGTSRQEAKATTRTKVLEAARTLFEDGGYEAATIRQIASWAGMSTGAVFASFSGKVELYREIYGFDPISPEVGRELLEALKELHLKTVIGTDAERHAALNAAWAAISRATSDPSEARQDDEAAAAMRGAA